MRLFSSLKFPMLALFALAGLAMVAVSCGGETVVERVVETVIVEKSVKGDTVVETVIVEKSVKGETVVVKGDTVVETVIVEKSVKGDTVIETVIVEKEKIVQQVVIATAQPGFVLQAPEPNPIRGGHIKTAWGATMRDFDIYQGGSGNVLSQMYDNLIRLNPTDGLKTVVPELATSWDISDDGMQYTFKLRQGVKWHDGQPFTSADVVATFDRIINPPTGIIIPSATRYDAIGNVEALDDFTVRFTLDKVRIWQFDMFTDVAAVIYPKHILDANDGDLRKLIAPGTGAMILDDKQDGEFWRFRANEDYWNPTLPYLDFATMLHVPAWTNRGTAVLTGVADFSWNVSVDTFNQGKVSDTVQVTPLPASGFLEVRWNNEKEPFTDVRVRRAMHLALNRQVAVDVYKEEQLTVSRWTNGEGRTPDAEAFQMPGYRTGAGFDEDLAEAKSLMAEAGFPDGAGLPEFNLTTASVPGHAEILAPFFVAQMEQIGMTINISAVERSLVNEEYKKDFDFVLSTGGGSPIYNYTPMWAQQFVTDASQNFGRYSNADFDSVVDKLNKETNLANRLALWAEGQDILDNDPPQIHFGFTAHAPMWQNYVKGLNMKARGQVEWGRYSTTAWLDK